jgi:serine/threonine protein phosphatase PrpC
MDFSTQAVLRFLQDSAGYDIELPATIRLAKKLSRKKSVQHYVHRLHNEIYDELDKTGPGIMSRSFSRNSRVKKKGIQHETLRKQLKNDSAVLPDLDVRFRVPNLTAGKSFKEQIKALDDLPDNMEFCDFHIDKELTDVSISQSSALFIEGKIDKSGDYEIELFCSVLHVTGAKQKVRGKLKVSVIPDPRSLWKNLPSDASAPFHKPDTGSESCFSEMVSLLAASVRGRSHAHKGIHRDDDIKLVCSATSDWNIVCVADGAGSCKYSRRGAELAVIHATRTLRETLNGHYGLELEKAHSEYLLDDSEMKQESLRQLQGVYQHTIVKAVYEAAKAIQEEVKNTKDASFKDFSTTLLLAAHRPVADGHLILSFWVGDGGAVIYKKNKELILLGEPDSGEYAGQTRFMDNKLFEDGSVYQRVNIQKVDSMTALILATDGITDAKFETEKQLSHIDPWDILWSELEPIVLNKDLKQGEKELLQWMDFWSPGNHDDRSIAICYVKQ